MGITASELLDDCNQAFRDCLAAEEYTIRGRMLRRARLNDLRITRKELMREIEVENAGGSMASVGRFVRPR